MEEKTKKMVQDEYGKDFGGCLLTTIVCIVVVMLIGITLI